MAKFRFEVYEDNAGGLSLWVLGADGAAIWAHSGYEYTPENLQEDIKNLESVDDAEEFEHWDGNGAYGGMDFDAWEDMSAGSIQAAYEETAGDEWKELVADSDGIYPERMGTAAKIAFNIEDED